MLWPFSVLVELTAFAMGWWHFRRSFLERNRHKKLKSNVKDMPLMWYLNYLAKCPKHREKTLKTNITSSCFQDAGKSLSPTASTLARSWQVVGKACAVSMSRNLTAPSYKSRRFVSSLLLKVRLLKKCRFLPFEILELKSYNDPVIHERYCFSGRTVRIRKMILVHGSKDYF